ncbi:flavin reductase family protein [Flagellimonas meridianipacifica]|uniref:Flavin reductase (DIM6/NTAB) family NADH-FMN oxidoreductase RutF n=1 Tax=Flagellimonas meridianipacifica TaxID=1080225 RepID=A0A2T0MJB4_9FLAO|nr:flavin reductase family protein [Allomuricauda pacifica]PRX57672.1 flavin reductase (DIM6/NTAB) family NADH-FMN oxidoreductase RutF [Allomuricauda pacifica]
MTKTIDPTCISQQDLHGILLTAVAPRPICFASTIDAAGNVNLSPFSYFNVFSSNPPVLIFSPARSGRDNTHKHSYLNVKEVPEVVINIVNHTIVEQMSLASTAYERGVNEFEKAGLTQIPSETVRPPRVGEAPVSFECKVQQTIELAEEPGAGNLVIAKVERIHISEKYLTDGQLDTKKLNLVGRMGGSWYVRASESALFEIPKPIRTKGIGVDALPKGIRESEVLTGNNLGRLGNLEALPSQDDLNSIQKDDEVQMMIKKLGGASEKLKSQLHWLAQRILEDGETTKAMALLMYTETL